MAPVVGFVMVGSAAMGWSMGFQWWLMGFQSTVRLPVVVATMVGLTVGSTAVVGVV